LHRNNEKAMFAKKWAKTNGSVHWSQLISAGYRGKNLDNNMNRNWSKLPKSVQKNLLRIKKSQK